MSVFDSCVDVFFFFFFKQKTAYEMRISDWSSDVCSSDLKRCAVKWGVGRYLYDIDAVWAECVTYESNGRKHFKEWTARGQSQLSAALNKVVPHVAPRPDQLVTDEQLMRLQNTADDVGADLQAFCK